MPNPVRNYVCLLSTKASLSDSVTPSPEVSYSDCIEYCHLQPARVYHHTGPVNTMYGLREGLALLSEEGLEKCWQRHKECAEKLHKGKKEGRRGER